jgi:dCTP deaminase
MIKNDKWIRKAAFEFKMIEPFEPGQVRDGKISFGTSSYGYDMRLSDEIMIIPSAAVLDPKNSDACFEPLKIKDFYEVAPHSVILGRTVEYFRIPRDIITIGFVKSTYARCGLLVNISPFEPEWEGFATLSIINPTQSAIRVYANEGIAQILFLQADDICEISYADKKGKYQTQKEITFSKI